LNAVITAGSKLRKVLFLALSVTLFSCQSDISGTAERICAKFIRKTCYAARSDEFGGQGERSKIKVTRDKNALCTSITPAATEWNALAANNAMQQQTGRFCRCQLGSDFGGLRVVYIW